MISRQKKPGNLFQSYLPHLLNHKNPLYCLANQIDWREFDDAFAPMYSADTGRPAKQIRLMVGLHYLKYAFDLSDEEVVLRWAENPYWQYFCGEDYFQTEFPIAPSLMTKWRQRLQSHNLEKLLEVTIKTGLKTKTLKKSDVARVNIDTTVQEKNITYPTDAKLYYRMLVKLGTLAKSDGIKLKQSYVRVGKRTLVMQNRYRHARQTKRANRKVRKLKTYLGRLQREIERKASASLKKSPQYIDLMDKTMRLFEQKRDSKNKLYSIHAPEVECISKGKVHKKYEFGCKVGVVSSSKNCFILGAMAFHGNPHDSKTLGECLEQAESLLPNDIIIEQAFVDQGYRGHKYEGGITINIVRRGWRKVKTSLRRWLSRRSAVEPVIGHMKNDCRLGRNYLHGIEGDNINAILSACGFNIRKLLADIFCLFFDFHSKIEFQQKMNLILHNNCKYAMSA